MGKFLRNCWVMAGWSHEIGDALLRRRILDDPILLYRRQDGTIAAMIDRCPHRFAPLSMGERNGDVIHCAYHGLAFDSEGACVLNPFSDSLPKGTQIRTFPVEERDGIVWLWPAEADKADTSLIPDFSMLFIEGHGPPLSGYTMMQANYEYGTDNLLDLSHIEFVHKGTFAGNGVIFAGEHELKEEGRQLHSNWFMRDIAAPPHTYGIYPPDMRCDHWLDMRWDPPASMYLAVGACAHGAARDDNPVIAHQTHILTPESDTTTHYFWATTRGGPPSEEGDAMMRTMFTQAFDEEDKPIIEAAYHNISGADFWDMKPAFLGIDAGGTKARRLIQKLIQQESNTHGTI
ncbi:MAG: Rieske 2Fe-2S domain-containing protein [Sphingomonadaceae bacterium]